MPFPHPLVVLGDPRDLGQLLRGEQVVGEKGAVDEAGAFVANGDEAAAGEAEAAGADEFLHRRPHLVVRDRQQIAGVEVEEGRDLGAFRLGRFHGRRRGLGRRRPRRGGGNGFRRGVGEAEHLFQPVQKVHMAIRRIEGGIRRTAAPDFEARTGDVHRAVRTTGSPANGGCPSAGDPVVRPAKRTTAPGTHTRAESAAAERRGVMVSGTRPPSWKDVFVLGGAVVNKKSRSRNPFTLRGLSCASS